MTDNIDLETFRRLTASAEPLYVAAFETCEARPVDDEALEPTPEDALATRHIAAASVAIQALLAGTPLTHRAVMLALGGACGAMLGQTEMAEHRELYHLFQSQFAKVLSAVTLAQRTAIDG